MTRFAARERKALDALIVGAVRFPKQMIKGIPPSRTGMKWGEDRCDRCGETYRSVFKHTCLSLKGAAMVRCKFICQGVTKTWDNYTKRNLFTAEFYAVQDGSPENKAFFASTPSGSLKVCSILPDIFEPGKEYYIDISPANAEAKP
jgi:hypothetical protein